jgi:hypothetical protein
LLFAWNRIALVWQYFQRLLIDNILCLQVHHPYLRKVWSFIARSNQTQVVNVCSLGDLRHNCSRKHCKTNEESLDLADKFELMFVQRVVGACLLQPQLLILQYSNCAALVFVLHKNGSQLHPNLQDGSVNVHLAAKFFETLFIDHFNFASVVSGKNYIL